MWTGHSGIWKMLLASTPFKKSDQHSRLSQKWTEYLCTIHRSHFHLTLSERILNCRNQSQDQLGTLESALWLGYQPYNITLLIQILYMLPPHAKQASDCYLNICWISLCCPQPSLADQYGCFFGRRFHLFSAMNIKEIRIRLWAWVAVRTGAPGAWLGRPAFIFRGCSF